MSTKLISVIKPLKHAKQRVSEKDAELMLKKMTDDFKDPHQPSTVYNEDSTEASSLFINESIVHQLIKKLTR